MTAAAASHATITPLGTVSVTSASMGELASPGQTTADPRARALAITASARCSGFISAPPRSHDPFGMMSRLMRSKCPHCPMSRRLCAVVRQPWEARGPSGIVRQSAGVCQVTRRANDHRRRRVGGSMSDSVWKLWVPPTGRGGRQVTTADQNGVAGSR